MSDTKKSAYCGFQPYSYRDFTKQLRQLLQDRYTWDGDGFTILKELIQNANDAGATSLHVGWSPPLFDATSTSIGTGRSRASSSSEAPHPLLTVPALFAVNNGPLRASDAINITRLGSNSKAGEASSAGRFGLGLKSVFHLCEAFFYLAQPFEEHASLCSIFNPWSPPRGADEVGPYEHWDFDPDGSVAKNVEVAICSRLEPIFAETSPSFCLWIPLRDERVLKGDALVKRNLLGADLGRILGDSTLHVRLAELLPLLHGLRDISVWIPNAKAAIEQRFAVSVEPSATRPEKLPEPDGEHLPPQRQSTFAGKVIVSSPDKTSPTSCEFVGAEAIVIRDSIQTLWKNKNWPPDESLDPVTNKWREHRVKLIPHGALRFMAIPKASGRGRVSMHWCVFLPLGQSNGDEHLEVEAAIASDVSIFLHGYFFIDAGRTRHVKAESEASDGRELDAESLQRSWNSTIEREAIWPQFLDAFSAFVSQMRWDDHQIEELTRAILALMTRIASIASSILPIVCRTKQWLYLLKSPTDSNKALGNWTLKTANAAVHDIPRPAASIALYDLLPGLAAVGSDRALTLASWPRISANKATPWSSTALRKVVGSVVPSVLFTSSDYLDYFARFLEHCADSEDQQIAVGEVLWPLLKNAFQDDSLTLQRIEELGDTLRRVLEFVPEEHRLVLSWADSERRGADAIFRLIAKDECDLLPIPSSVRPTTGRECKTIESGIVGRLLRSIGDVSLDNILLADVVGDLLKRADLERKTLWQSFNDVRLLVIYDCGRKQTTRKTWLELNEQKQRRLVFCDQAGLTQQLQAALGDAGSVWRIDPDFAAKVLDDKDDKHGFPGCSARECAAVLAPPQHGNAVHFGGAALGAWEARRELLKKLVGALGTGASADQELLKDACRLLIHGRSQDAKFNAALFLAADGHFDALAEKLVRHVVAKRQEEWRILIGEPAVWAVEDGLTTSQQKSLDLYPLAFSEPAVLNFLEKANPDQLNGIDLSKDEYATLLTDIETSRNELLKQLPIHPVSKGKQRIAIPSDDPPRYFWDDGYELDADLTESITLLALDRGRDKRVADRQRELAPVLDREQALRLALKSPQPEKHWLAILKAIEKSEERLPDDIVTDLCTKPWFPTRFGGKNRDKLICLTVGETDGATAMSEDFRQEVTRLVEACDGAFVPDWMLDDKFRKHLSESRKIACQRLNDWGVLPDKTQSLQKLSLLLAQGEQNCIGSVAHDHFEDWLTIDWDTSVMPAHQVLKAVADLVGSDICFEHASADVRRPIEDHNRLVAILNWLALCHEKRLLNQDLAFRVFRNYFGILISSNNDHIPKGLEKLLAQSGKWQRPKDLCLPTKGIADHCQLHRDLAKFLSKPPSDQVSDDFEDKPYEPGNNENPTLTDDVDRSAPTVRDYFCPWEIRVQLPVIGGFLAVLGADERLREYAERVLGKFRLEDIRDDLVRQVNGPLTESVMTPRSVLGSSTTIRQADAQTVGPFTDRVASLNRTYFSIRVVSAEKENVRNIIGGDFDAELKSDGDDLLLGFGDDSLVKIERDGTRRVCSIRLRRVLVESKTQDELNRILCTATQSILVEAFYVPVERAKTQAEKLFSRLAKSDYLEITATQRMILSGAFVNWEQLGLSSDAAFRPILAELKRCLRSQPQNRTSNKRSTESTRGLEDAYRDLQDLIETDVDAQERCLAAVRHQVGDNNQYNHRSVLFELAQNADDALLEANKREPIRLFVYPDRIAIRHFGRKINQVPPESTTSDDPHADDLWKMLTLWLTNKNELDTDSSQVNLTGKFGLGFKSVFLVSNQPRLLSGQLACVIVGGVFPRYLNTTERECFDRYLTDLTTPEQKLAVTIIELPLSPRGVNHDTGAHADEVSSKSSHIDAASIVGRFRELAHLLVVFSQRIRQIEIVDEATGKTHKTEWQDQPVPGVSGCFKGTLQPLPELLSDPTSAASRLKDDDSARRVLVLRTSHHNGALLLVHRDGRFQKLPKEVPTLWVTAPTLEMLDVGFALNARFSLDPGRAQLGRESPKNNEIAAELGRELGQRLVALFEHSRKVGWPQFSQDIGLDSDASEYKFWDSLWELLGPGLSSLSEKSNAAKLLLHVFWQADWSAARYFYSSSRALPNGLDAEFACLTTVRDVRYELRGLVAELRVLERVATWTAWEQKKMAPASCLGRERVVIPLEKLGRLLGPSAEVAKLETEVVKLEDMLRCEIAGVSPMSSETATRLSEVLFSEPCVSKEFDETGEWKQIVPILKTIVLPDRTGNSQPAKQLLFGTLPENMNDAFLADEVKLAAFAFSDRVLCRQFLISKSVRSVVRLIRKCRGDQELKAQDIAGWALKASLAEAKKAVEHYLAQGRRRDEVIEALRSRDAELRCSWLAGLVGTNVLQTAGEREQGIVDCIVHYETRRARLAQSDDILRKVLDWWRSPERPFLDPRRYRLFDPTQHGPLRMDYDRDDIAQRKAWMRLFLLGISHTMGRTSASQDAGFICDFCEERGWLDVFVEPDGDPDRWIRLLRDYLEAQIDTSQYLHWMRQFVAIFAMAERLDDYIASFLSIERKSSRFSLTAITCPGTSNEAPVDAPPIARILGMGACFIVRELLRLKILTNHLAWEHAFVPKGEVRQLLELLGCTFESKSEGPWMRSREVWSFLKEKFPSDNNAIFELGFDLPFQMLAHKDNSGKRFELLSVDWKYDEADDQQD